jgi:hypothetical protein
MCKYTGEEFTRVSFASSYNVPTDEVLHTAYVLNMHFDLAARYVAAKKIINNIFEEERKRHEQVENYSK